MASNTISILSAGKDKTSIPAQSIQPTSSSTRTNAVATIAPKTSLPTTVLLVPIEHFTGIDTPSTQQRQTTATWLLDGCPSSSAIFSSATNNTDLQTKREALGRKLLLRPKRNQLIQQGILPATHVPSVEFHEKQQQLQRAQTGDALKRKIERRPDKAHLISQHILLSPPGNVDPSLIAKQQQLKKCRLVNNLNDKLAHRPGPLDLVKDNILRVESEQLQRDLRKVATLPQLTTIKFHEYKGPPPPRPKVPPVLPPSTQTDAGLSVSLLTRSPAVATVTAETTEANSNYETILEQQQILLTYQGDKEQLPTIANCSLHPKPQHGSMHCEQQRHALADSTCVSSTDGDSAECPSQFPPSSHNGVVSTSVDNHQCTCGRQQQSVDGDVHHGETTLTKSDGEEMNGIAKQTSPVASKLADLKVSELKAECKKRSLPVSGPKPHLLERLKPYEDHIAAATAGRRSSVDSIEVASGGVACNSTSASTVVAPVRTTLSSSSSASSMIPSSLLTPAAQSTNPPNLPPIQNVISDFLRAHSLSVPNGGNLAIQPPPPMQQQLRAAVVAHPPTPGSADFSSDTSGVASNYSSPGVDIGGLSFNPTAAMQQQQTPAFAPPPPPPIGAPQHRPPMMQNGQRPLPPAISQATNDKLNDLAAAVTASALSEHEGMLRRQQQKIEELQRELQGSQDQLKRQQQVILAAKKTQCLDSVNRKQPPTAPGGAAGGASSGASSDAATTETWLAQLDTKQLQKFHIQLFLQHKLQQQQLQQQIALQQELAATQARLQEELGVQSAMNEVVRLLKQDPRVAVLIVQLLRKFQAERIQQQRANANFVQQPPQQQPSLMQTQHPMMQMAEPPARPQSPHPQSIPNVSTSADDSQPMAKLSKGETSPSMRTVPKQKGDGGKCPSPSKKVPANNNIVTPARPKTTPRKSVKSVPSSPSKKEPKTTTAIGANATSSIAATAKQANPVHMEEIFKAVLESNGEVTSAMLGDEVDDAAAHRLPSCEQFMLPMRQQELLSVTKTDNNPPSDEACSNSVVESMMYVDDSVPAPTVNHNNNSCGMQQQPQQQQQPAVSSSFGFFHQQPPPPATTVQSSAAMGANEDPLFYANQHEAFDDLMEVLRSNDELGSQLQHANGHHRVRTFSSDETSGMLVSNQGGPMGNGGVVYPNTYGSQELGQLLGHDWMAGIGGQSSLLPPFGGHDSVRNDMQLGFDFEPTTTQHHQHERSADESEIGHRQQQQQHMHSRPIPVPQPPMSENLSTVIGGGSSGGGGDPMDWLDLILPSPSNGCADLPPSTHIGIATPPYRAPSGSQQHCSSNPVLGQGFVKQSQEGLLV